MCEHRHILLHLRSMASQWSACTGHSREGGDKTRKSCVNSLATNETSGDGRRSYAEHVTEKPSFLSTEPRQTPPKSTNVESWGLRGDATTASGLPASPALNVGRPLEAMLTLMQKSRVMKKTAMRRKRKKSRNHAVQCSQLLSPIMRMYSWGESGMLSDTCPGHRLR